MTDFDLTHPGGQKHFNVGEDMDAVVRAKFLKGRPYEFLNLLPIPVTLYVTLPVKLDLIGTIAPFGKLTTHKTKSGMEIKGEQDLHITYEDGKITYEILRPVALFYDTRTVRIGDVVQTSKDTTMVMRSHADISGIRIHNRIGIPLNITYHGNIIATVEKDDGTNFMSGAPNSVFINNDGRGFNYGDNLSFSFRNGMKYCDIIINDNYLTDIYVGVINQKFSEVIRDYYSYNMYLDINGLKYYENTGKTAYYGY